MENTFEPLLEAKGFGGGEVIIVRLATIGLTYYFNWHLKYLEFYRVIIAILHAILPMKGFNKRIFNKFFPIEMAPYEKETFGQA